MSDEESIAEERAAIGRLNDAIAQIAADLHWYWHWGDGEGDIVLSKLRAAVLEAGKQWPYDSKVRPQVYQKKKIGRKLAKMVMERDAYRCVTCGTHHDLCCDHIHPETLGGPTTLDNLQTMCRSCNSKKGARI